MIVVMKLGTLILALILFILIPIVLIFLWMFHNLWESEYTMGIRYDELHGKGDIDENAPDMVGV